MFTLIYYAGRAGGPIAESLAAMLRLTEPKQSAGVRAMRAFDGLAEPCDAVVLVGDEGPNDRARLASAYGARFRQITMPAEDAPGLVDAEAVGATARELAEDASAGETIAAALGDPLDAPAIVEAIDAPPAPPASPGAQMDALKAASATEETPAERAAVVIPDNWRALPWGQLKSLASKCTDAAVWNKPEAIAAIEGELARRNSGV